MLLLMMLRTSHTSMATMFLVSALTKLSLLSATAPPVSREPLAAEAFRNISSPGNTPDLTGNHTWSNLLFSLRDIYAILKIQ